MSTTSSSSTPPLSSFSTCELSDALIKLGIPHGGHIPDIYRVCPSPNSQSTPSTNRTLCGPAYTVQMVLGSDAAPRLKEHFVDTAEEGSVMVINTPPLTKNAVWGGLMSAGAQARGVLGVIISGRCRDLDEQDGFEFPIFARGHSTLGQSPFTKPAAVNVPITIEPQPTGSGFPAITVEPGDYVVGDRDGVVCVPKGMIDEVVKQAIVGREADERCMEDIKKGLGVAASFKKHRS